MSTTTTTTNPYPDLPIPAGAVWAEWQDPGTPYVYRLFAGSKRVIARSDASDSEPTATAGLGGREMELYIGGTQNPDGVIERHIVPPDLHPDRPITLRQAFELGLALMELALEGQEMAKRDQQLGA
jgi:hypothetical protein